MSAMPQVNKVGKVLYTAKVHTTGGRDGASRGNVDVTIALV